MATRHIWSLVLLVTAFSSAHAQFGIDWNTAGNGTAGPNSYIGTTDATPLNFRTNQTLRMRLNHNLSQNINGTGFISRNGYLGLSGSPTFFAGTAANPGPFARLHLDDSANPLLGTY